MSSLLRTRLPAPMAAKSASRKLVFPELFGPMSKVRRSRDKSTDLKDRKFLARTSTIRIPVLKVFFNDFFIVTSQSIKCGKGTDQFPYNRNNNPFILRHILPNYFQTLNSPGINNLYCHCFARS